MSFLKYLRFLWPDAHRERAEAEAQTNQDFRDQLKEALLMQDNLLEAAASMKRAREERFDRPSYHRKFRNSSSG